MKTTDGVRKDVEDMTDEELHSLEVFLKGRIKLNKFVSETSKDSTHDDFSQVDYELKRRKKL